MDGAIKDLAAQLNKEDSSFTHAALHTLKQAPQALLDLLSGCYRYMVKTSEPAVQAARPTKAQMGVIAFGAACYCGGTHALASLLSKVVASQPESSLLLSSLQNMLGLAVQTSSLPILLAMTPRFKNAFRRLQKSNISKRFFTSHRVVQDSRKEVAFRDLVINHPDLLDRPFPMAAVFNDLRNLQALRGLSSNRDYKLAERRLFRVQHESELGQGAPLTVRQVTQLLQPDDSVGRVYGIGATKAERFVQAGFLTLEQLREASLERAQRIGLKHMDDIECLIPRSESEQWRDIMLDVFRTVDPHLGAELLGSFRRGDLYFSDLDFVLFHPDVINLRNPRPDNPTKYDPHPLAASLITSVIDELRVRSLLANDVLAHGPLAMEGLVRLDSSSKVRRIDLNFAPFTRHAFYTLAKTGDADLMVHLRAKAKARGWALNE
ncbi:hypothetical protein EX895_005946 [Sporisorium graminicola]|uniref:DNA polymerase n=1 Tax=Sporisorium graminicola TaxID=280036 RepID=A0A4U7KM12_9BASI|nr:hypothetical protein EX895_005946 [Sporisorium graminicola]TKY84866.1 hypothetical protein EX895_005946 [Sporisorium graminicola]